MGDTTFSDKTKSLTGSTKKDLTFAARRIKYATFEKGDSLLENLKTISAFRTTLKACPALYRIRLCSRSGLEY